MKDVAFDSLWEQGIHEERFCFPADRHPAEEILLEPLRRWRGMCN